MKQQEVDIGADAEAEVEIEATAEAVQQYGEMFEWVNRRHYDVVCSSNNKTIKQKQQQFLH